MSLNSVMSKCRHEGWITEEHYKEYIELVKLQESSEAQRKFLASRVEELRDLAELGEAILKVYKYETVTGETLDFDSPTAVLKWCKGAK